MAKQTATKQVIYCKLSSGDWGLRGPAGSLVPGQQVTVHKKDGTTKTETPRAVQNSDTPGEVIATLARDQRSSPSSKSSGSSREMCAECNERAGVRSCLDSSGLSGMCCARCASMSRWERSFA